MIHRVQSDDFLLQAARQKNPQEEGLAQRVSAAAGGSSVLPNPGRLSAMQATIDSDALLYPVTMEGEQVYLKVTKYRSYHPNHHLTGEYTDFYSYLTPVFSYTSYYSRRKNSELHPVPRGFLPCNGEGVPIDPPFFEEIVEQESLIRIFRSAADDEKMYVVENPNRVPYQPVEYSRYKPEEILLPGATLEEAACKVVDSQRFLYPVCIKGQRVYHEMEPVFSYPTYYFQRKTKGDYVDGKKIGDHWKVCAVSPTFAAYDSKGVTMECFPWKYRRDETVLPIEIPRYSFGGEKLYAGDFPLYYFDKLLYYLNPNPSPLRSMDDSGTRVCFQNPKALTRDSFSELRAVDEPFMHLPFKSPTRRFTCLSFDGKRKISDVTALVWKEELEVSSKPDSDKDILLFLYHRNGDFRRFSVEQSERLKGLPVSGPSRQSLSRNPSVSSLSSRGRCLSQESIDDAARRLLISGPAGVEVVVDKASGLHESVNNS